MKKKTLIALAAFTVASHAMAGTTYMLKCPSAAFLSSTMNPAGGALIRKRDCPDLPPTELLY